MREEERSGARVGAKAHRRRRTRNARRRRAMAARLKERYAEGSGPGPPKKEFGIDNAMAIPRLEKIVLNMGLGEAVANPKMLDGAVEELSAIAGQRAVVTKAKKSIATYKLRTGMPIGARVTLRGRPDVGVPRPADQHRAAARARLPRACRARRSTAAATTRSACATTSSSRDRLCEDRQVRRV